MAALRRFRSFRSWSARLWPLVLLVGLALRSVAQEASSSAPPAAAPASGATATAPNAPAAPLRNVVIVTLDTVRADHLASYGYFRDPMPSLGRFMADAVRVTDCQAPVSHTTPSHASLFTSTYPFEHGILGNSINQSGEGPKAYRLITGSTLQTLAQAARATGRRTGGFVAATPIKKFTGLDAGFDSWTEPAATRRVGENVVRDALRFLDAAEGPFLLFVHLYDAHGPYQEQFGPPEFIDFYGAEPPLDGWLAERRIAAAVAGRGSHKVASVELCNQYAGSLRFLDAALQPLLERLARPDRAADTVVAITADHGQGLGQHGFRGHGIVWGEQLHVPLFLRVPGRAAAVVDATCSTLDLVPTLVGLIPDLVPPEFAEQLRGQDLLAGDFAERPVFAYAEESYGMEAVTTARWKLIRKPGNKVDLFDRADDPHELKNVAAKHPEVVAELRALLDAEKRGQLLRAKLHRARSAASTLDPALAEELRELGYGVGGDEEGAGEDGDGGGESDGKEREEGGRSEAEGTAANRGPR